MLDYFLVEITIGGVVHHDAERLAMVHGEALLVADNKLML